VEVTNGNPIWFKEFSSASGFDVDNRGLIAADADDTVQAFDRRGTPMWTKKGFARRRLSAPLITGSAVAFGDLQGNLLWLSRADGTLLAISRTDGKPIVAPAAAAGSTLVVQTSGGTLHAFRTE
jgi:outer membrane protein assembly factor BamB